MEEIKNWLTGSKDYDSGLMLLGKYSKNRVLLQNLARKRIPDKLEYELRKLSSRDIIKVEQHVRETLPGIKMEKFIPGNGEPRVNPDELPPHLKTLWDETAEKYRLARALHEKLKNLNSREEIKAGVDQLEAYRLEIRANWDVIDTWIKERNEGREAVTVDEKRINANRKYLSDRKKSVNSLHGAIRAKKLEAMQRRVNELLSVGEKFTPENQKELQELGLNFNG